MSQTRVAVAINRSAQAHDRILAERRFSINLLAADHGPLARLFAGGDPARAGEAAARQKGLRLLGSTEKERRVLAKQLRAVTGASARQCEKALESNGDDMDRAAIWLLEQSPSECSGADDASDVGSTIVGTECAAHEGVANPNPNPNADEGVANPNPNPNPNADEGVANEVLAAVAKKLQLQGHVCALVVSNAGSLPAAASARRD